MTERRKAPWRDFSGNPIHEGDLIRHPSGQEGKVVFLAEHFKGAEATASDQWRVDYGDGQPLSRLVLQIDDKGKAIVVAYEDGLPAATNYAPPGAFGTPPSGRHPA